MYRTYWLPAAVLVVASVASAAMYQDAAPPQPTSREAAQIDKQKFSSLHHAAFEVSVATQRSDMTRERIKPLIESLAAELSAVKAKTPAEVQMVARYTEALGAYRDGLRFWELRRFPDQPGNREALNTLAAKYDTQAESRTSYTAAWQGYPPAVPKIWAVGNAAAAEGATLYDRRGPL